MSEATSAPKTSWKSWLALFALLGIIAAVAVPQYADYTHRAQAAETVAILGAAKFPLAEYFADKRKWPGRIEEVTGNTSGKYTLSVTITKGAGGSGEIELTGTMRAQGVDRRVRGQSVRLLSSDGGRNWLCRPGTMEPKNLPTACRD